MKAKAVAPAWRQTAPMGERRLKEDKGADHIRLNESAGSVDRSIDMALGSQMHDDVGFEIRKDGFHRRSVADVALAERIARILRNGRQRSEIAGISQLVEDKDPIRRILDDPSGNSGSDKSSAARHENAHPRLRLQKTEQILYSLMNFPDNRGRGSCVRRRANCRAARMAAARQGLTRRGGKASAKEGFWSERLTLK